MARRPKARVTHRTTSGVRPKKSKDLLQAKKQILHRPLRGHPAQDDRRVYSERLDSSRYVVGRSGEYDIGKLTAVNPFALALAIIRGENHGAVLSSATTSNPLAAIAAKSGGVAPKTYAMRCSAVAVMSSLSSLKNLVI